MIHHDVCITVIARSKRRRHRRHLDDESLGQRQSLTQEVVVGRKGLHPLHKSQRFSLLSITSALLMMRFTSSPSEWGLIGVAKRRRGSGNSDRYPNPPRGAASPPASFALVVGDGAVASRVPVFSRLPTQRLTTQHSRIDRGTQPTCRRCRGDCERPRASDTTRGRGRGLQICKWTKKQWSH